MILNPNPNAIIKTLKHLPKSAATAIPIGIYEAGVTHLQHTEALVSAQDFIVPALLTALIYTADHIKDGVAGDKRRVDLAESGPLIPFLGLTSIPLLDSMDKDTFIPLMPVLFSYREIKPYLGLAKSFNIGLGFAILSYALPTPIAVDPQLFMAIALSIMSSSNAMDILDIEDDRANEIQTIPAVYGAEKGVIVSIVTALIGSALFVTYSGFDIMDEIDVFLALPFGVWFGMENYLKQADQINNILN